MEEKTVKVRVTGRVQGVYFRGWTRERALELGLRGWVRNEADGAVTALFCGPPEAVDKMLAALWQGPKSAQVNGVAVEEAEPGLDMTGFDIRR